MKKEKKRKKEKRKGENLPDFNSLHPNRWAREVGFPGEKHPPPPPQLEFKDICFKLVFIM